MLSQCQWDHDEPDLFKEDIRRAAKTHRCSECREAIQAGDIHRYASSLYDGSWSHWRTCMTCWRIGNDLCGGCWEVGEMWRDIWDDHGVTRDAVPTDDDGYMRTFDV